MGITRTGFSAQSHTSKHLLNRVLASQILSILGFAIIYSAYRLLVMTASDARGPGLLYVNSQIDSAKISPEVFTKWYEDEHISDILRTSGMNSAYRYYTTSTEEAKEEEPNSRPYLALYPLEDISFLETEEFKSIPVHSDLVPTEGRCIFDVADFDVRYYTSLGREESQSAEIGK